MSLQQTVFFSPLSSRPVTALSFVDAQSSVNVVFFFSLPFVLISGSGGDNDRTVTSYRTFIISLIVQYAQPCPPPPDSKVIPYFDFDAFGLWTQT